LGGGPPIFPRDSSCPVVLWIPARFIPFSFTGLLPSSARLSSRVLLKIFLLTQVLNPTLPKECGLGSFPFARRYSENRCFFLFLRLLRCFSSPGSLLIDYFIHLWVTRIYPCRVSPFGNPWLNVCLLLTMAYRSLPRPSSAPSA
jgi:hypothetical protein